MKTESVEISFYHVWAEAAGGKRVPKVNEESKQVLERLVAESRCWRVFSQPAPRTKREPGVLESAMGRLREKLARDKIMLD